MHDEEPRWRESLPWERTAALLVVALIAGSAATAHGCRSDDTGTDTDRETSDVSDLSRDGADADPGRRALSGTWYAADFHVHAAGASNDAGEESTPEAIKRTAQQRGLDVVVLTDHSNSTGSDPSTREEDPDLFNMGPEFPYWERARELSDEDFLMVDGNELSPVDENSNEPTGHTGCYPRTLEEFDPDIAFRDRPRGEVEGGEALAQAREAGCFTTINHPYSVAQWIAYDWTSDDYDALEVWNGGGGFDFNDLESIKAWACDHGSGRDVLAIGGSDNHRVEIEPPGDLTNPPLGQPVTWVYAERLRWSAIVEALDARRVSISDTGSPLAIDVLDERGDWLAFTGGSFSAERAAAVRITGSTRREASEEQLLRLFRIGSDCEDPRAPHESKVPDPNWEVVERWQVEPDSTFEFQTELAVDPGESFFAFLGPEEPDLMHQNVALSNAVTAE